MVDDEEEVNQMNLDNYSSLEYDQFNQGKFEMGCITNSSNKEKKGVNPDTKLKLHRLRS